jgi:hypothetical protein
MTGRPRQGHERASLIKTEGDGLLIYSTQRSEEVLLTFSRRQLDQLRLAKDCCLLEVALRGRRRIISTIGPFLPGMMLT